LDILSQPVLILNTSYLPITIKTVRDAICMVLLDKAEVLKSDSNQFVRSEKLKIPVPNVILLSNYYQLPKRKIRVSRHTILERDDYQCKYCGKKPSPSKLTLDHIIPRSRWNDIPKEKKPIEFNSWDNIVTACRECNTKKGSKLLSELKWKFPEITSMSNYSYMPNISESKAEKYGWKDYLAF
jgi:5-methylcytosine-specific restriction endonuclease McrA